MRSNYLKTLKTAVLAISVLLLGAGVSFAQQVNLTAGPGHMRSARWLVGAHVGLHLRRSGDAAQLRTCAALNPAGDGLVPGGDHGAHRAATSRST